MSMKLGTQTASMMNHIFSRATKGQPEPEVGMGATFLRWTDRQAGTIVSVEKIGGATIIGVQHDTEKLISDTIFSDAQEYEYTRNPNARIEYFRWRNEAWEAVKFNVDTGRWNKADDGGVRIGERQHYRDPSF